MAGKPTSALDALVDEAVDLVVRLEKLDGDMKLSFPAFLKEALRIGDCTEKRIAAVQRIVDERHGTDGLQIFLRRMSKLFSERQYTRPFDDPSRPVRIYGSETLEGQMGQHQIRSGELQALAVVVAFERFGDEAFGPVKNWEGHQQQITELRETLVGLYEELRDVVSGKDLIIDVSEDRLLPDERKRGLAHVSFKLAPDINLGENEWPQQLVQSVAASAPKRERIEKAA